MKGLLQILAERDSSAFLKFVNSNRIHKVSNAEAIEFYKKAPEKWVLFALLRQIPSPEVEKAIICYNSKVIVKRLYNLYRFYPQTITWALRTNDSLVTEKVLATIKGRCDERADEETEVAFLKRGEAELFKIYLQKFHILSEAGEKLLSEDYRLSPLLSIYLDYQMEI